MTSTRHDDPSRATPVKPTGPTFIDAKRRGLLQGAAVAAAGVAAAPVVADTDMPVEPVAAEPAPSGYRLTDHVREYYAKARF